MSKCARPCLAAVALLVLLPGVVRAQSGRPAITSTGALGDVEWPEGGGTYYLNTDNRSIDVFSTSGGYVTGPQVGRVVSQPGGPDLVVFDFASLTVGNTTVHVVGSLHRPAVIAATGTVVLGGLFTVWHGGAGATDAQQSAAPPGGGGGGDGPGHQVLVWCGGMLCTESVSPGGGGGGGGLADGQAGAAGNLVSDKDGVAHQHPGGGGGGAVFVKGGPLAWAGGGGASGAQSTSFANHAPGGAGGGALMVTTPGRVTVTGSVWAAGYPGGNGSEYGGGGGGGGGGGMLVFQVGGTLQVAPTGQIIARGGLGGNSPAAPGQTFAQGGTGGGGLIEIDAALYTNAGLVSAGDGIIDVVPRTTKLTGTITRAWGGAMQGVTVTLDGFLKATTTTDVNGAYTFSSLARSARYSVTPSIAGYLMAPVTGLVDNLQGDTTLDFAGTQPSISGRVTRLDGSPLAGVTVALAGDAAGTAVTDAAGAYVFPHVPYLGTYTLAMSRSGFVCTPPSAMLGPLSASQSVDVVAAALIDLRGHVRDLNGSGVGGVTVTLSGTPAGSTATDGEGLYTLTGLVEGRSYTLSPARPSFSFSPATVSVDAPAAGLTQDFLVTSGVFRRYFAEGAVSPFFDSEIALFNATTSPASTTVRFFTGRLETRTLTFDLGGLSRVTIDPKQHGLVDDAFATVVESAQPLIADRTMWWDARHYGGHAETSVASPLTTWYFAEGATHSGFDLFYLLLNQATTAAEVEITYLRPEPAPPIVKTYTLPPSSRVNVWVDYEDEGLADTDVSAVIRVTNGVPIIAERAMYLTGQGRYFNAGHESAGVPEPSTEWFLAEGATGPFFDLFILIANPGDTEAVVEARYLRASGAVIPMTYRVAARSRFNIWVDLEGPPLADTPVSTVITSTNGVPVIVERAMWWPTGPAQWYEAHNSAGATRAGTKWALAEGYVGTVNDPVYTYVLIANTSDFAALARVRLVYQDGSPGEEREFTLPANSRFNVDVGFQFPSARGRRFGTIVESLGDPAAQLVVERAMYNAAEYVFFAAGTNAVGTRLK